MKKKQTLASLLLATIILSHASTLAVLADDVVTSSTEMSSEVAVSSTTEVTTVTEAPVEEATVVETAETVAETPAVADVASESAPVVTEATTESTTEVSTETTGTKTQAATTAVTSATTVAQAVTSSQVTAAETTSQIPAATTNPVTNTSLLGESLVNATPVTQLYYVEHWSGSDAYTHNLLSHRYGITAKQLDGYLDSLGINYDKTRINGKLLLEWEKKSGLDVRAIIAIAIAESSLGTAGVATMPGANMFGYGAFDSNPENAANYNDATAVIALTRETIVGHKNLTFKAQDIKAQKNAAGTLDTLNDGGVYYTDTSGSGERRAQIMEDIDQWIDAHGGTPVIPEELKTVNVALLTQVPANFDVPTPLNTASYTAATYPWGQCTWYVYNRAQELGYSFDAYMGNGGDWQYKAGYETSHEPKVGAALSFSPGQAGADGTYGHVAIVEAIAEDGTVLISESNAMGLGVVSYRTFSADQAAQFTYVTGKKLN
ncbi:CHAP domain-containing protein [Streptococcus caprae]|uniref:CHAP domain-containing protein n=1 Tax=Streptococcus caprae TaxID=1640501 RepID=A0ABV8CX43_9STRE